MNTSLLASIKYIVSKHGEGILADPVRLNPEFAKFAKNEPKEQRIAFGRCIEMGCYREIKKARTSDERRNVKENLVLQLHKKTNIPINQCSDALDLLDAAVFGNVVAPSQLPVKPKPKPINTPPVINPPPIQSPFPAPTPVFADRDTTLRILSRFALLLVIIGFFMPIYCNLNAFEIANVVNQSGSLWGAQNLSSTLVVISIYLIFAFSCIGVLIGFLLMMKIQVPKKYDWYTLLATIGLLIYFIFAMDLRNSDWPLQSGGYLILIGLGISLLLLLMVSDPVAPNNTNNNNPATPPPNTPPNTQNNTSCPKCGANIVQGNIFCTVCGAKI